MISDKEYIEIQKSYRAKFGKSFPRVWGSNLTDEERVARMREAIKTGVPAVDDIPPHTPSVKL